jgi:hypothetical protein
MYTAPCLFVAANIGAVLAALLATQTISPGRERWHMALVGISSYGIIANATVLILGLSGLLTPYHATATTTLIALTFLTIRHLGSRKGSAAPKAHDLPPRSDKDPLRLLALSLLAGAFGLQLMHAAFDATVLKWDDLSYHAAVTAQWLVDQRISIPPSTYQAYYPFSSELLSLWFMLPFGDDAYASLSALYWLLLASTAIFGIIRGTGGSASTALLLTAVFVASTRVTELSRSFSSNDLAGASLILAAMAVAIPAASHRYCQPCLAWSGLLIGMAVGSKVTFVLPGAVVFAWLMLRSSRMTPSEKPWSSLVSILAPAVLIGGYWYARNWVLTGNPIFPAEIGPLPGAFDTTSSGRTAAWNWLVDGRVPAWQLSKLLDWPYPMGLMALGGYVLFIRKLFSSSRASCATGSGIDYALFSCGILILISFPFMPFSGTINRPYAEVYLDNRYIVLFFIIGLVLYRHVFSMNGHWRPLGYLLPFSSLAFCISALGIVEVAFLVAFGISGFIITRHFPKPSNPRLVGMAVASAFFVSLSAFHPTKLSKTTDQLYAYDGPKKRVGRAWKELERLPVGSSIAFFMSEPGEYTQHYPIFGRHLQFQPAYVDADGRARKPMHQSPDREMPSWWGGWEQGTSGWRRRSPGIPGAQLVRNLRASGTQFVLSSRWSLGHWPPQHQLLKETPQAVELFNDGYSAIWEIRPGG